MQSPLCAGLQRARTWALRCVAKRGGTLDDASGMLVKRWCMPGTPDDAAIQKAAAALRDGFKKVAVLCGSPTGPLRALAAVVTASTTSGDTAFPAWLPRESLYGWCARYHDTYEHDVFGTDCRASAIGSWLPLPDVATARVGAKLSSLALGW